jgi:hypothetical protein
MHLKILEELYLNCRETYLSEVNHRFLTVLCSILGIRTTLSRSSDYEVKGTKTDRLVRLASQAGASAYLSGPSARAYLQPELFEESGIRLFFADYSGYPEYRQLFPPFEHQVSVIDLIVNEGPLAARYLKELLPLAAKPQEVAG